MEFLNEKSFPREEYDKWLRRLHYDDRDTVMYENMLSFLWEHIICPEGVSDREGLLEEYSHWNLQMIDKCFTNLPHNLPYINIRRAYQSIIHLLDGDVEAGLWQLEKIGKEAFMQDGKPTKLHMTKQGKVYHPRSRLFLISNYDKLLREKDPDLAGKVREDYPFPFKTFGDEAHKDHDQFLENQLTRHQGEIFYPEYERVYQLPGGMREFFLYFDEEKGIPVNDCLNYLNCE